MTARILTSGIDTLHLFTRAVVRDEVAAALTAAKERAAATGHGGAPEVVDVAGHTLHVAKHGARTAPLLLESEHMAVRVNPRAAKNLPSVAVELRSLYLWQRGAVVCCMEAQRVVDALSVAPPPGALISPLHVSRVDLAVDFQGWLPRPDDDPRFVTRAGYRTTHRDRGTFTGFMFGHGVIAARLYDKTTEIRRSRKRWFRRVWAESALYVPTDPVWRLEFQIRREALRAFRLHDDGASSDALALDEWPDVLEYAPLLWRYLCARWLSLRLPRTKDTRQRLTTEWEGLMRDGFADGVARGAGADLYRDAREVVAANTTAQLAGYLAANLAAYRFLAEPAATLDDALPLLIERAKRHAVERGTSIDARAEERLQGWEQTAQSIAEGSEPRTPAVDAEGRAS